MELNYTINNTWKFCIIASILGCFILLLFLNQDDQNLILSAGSTAHEVTSLDVVENPMSTIISEQSKPSLFVTSPPIPSSTSQENVIIEPNKSTKLDFYTESTTNKFKKESCNIFNGKWVYKPDKKPYYDTNSCPFIEEKMNCQKNGRVDFEYEKWNWKANDCDIPLFNGKDMLERLRNKRVIMVGDSLNRNMWESLACLLYTSVPSSRVEVDANGSDYKVLKTKDYNVTLEFYWSPFLIDFDKNHKSGKKVLVLEKLSPNFKKWLGADIMVFNSGHWYTHTRKLKAWDLFQYKEKLLEKMSIDLAYDIAMKTWGKWIQNNVDPKKTKVFFRSISAQHTGEQWCYDIIKPFMDDSFVNGYPKSLINIIESVIKDISKVKVQYLNITKLTEYRIDAHSSVYWSSSKWKIVAAENKKFLSSYADCIHWCLPGLPDTWNELLYASLFYHT